MANFDPNKIISTPTTVKHGAPSTYTKIDVDKFSPQLGENFFGELPSLYQQRAEAQTFWESTGNFWARGLTKAALSIPETLGHILNVPGWVTADEDFNNVLSEWSREAKENLDENIFPEYSRDTVDEAEFKPWSLGWWSRNGDSVIESLGYFVPGMAAGKLAGAALKGSQAAIRGAKALETFQGLNTAEKIANAGSVITATLLSNHAEGMQIAAQTYADTYDQIIKATGDKEKAKEFAHQAATKASLGNYAMILTDIPQFKLMFKGFDDIRRGANFSKSWAKRNLPELLSQSMFEGGEELYQGILEREAKRSALIEAGALEDDGSGLMERFFDYVASPEGMTEGFLGAMGGAAFTGIFGTLQKEQNTLDRTRGLAQIQRQADSTRRLLAKNEEELRKVNEAIDMNNPLAVDSAIEGMFRNQAWAAAERGTFTQLEELLDMASQANDEVLKKEGWSREEVEKRIPKFKQILTEVEDIYNRVQNIAPNASSAYKMKQGNHLLQIEGANSSIKAARDKKLELLRNTPEAPEDVTSVTYEEAIDLQSKIDGLTFLEKAVPASAEKYKAQREKAETKLNKLLADNPSLVRAKLKLDPVNSIKLMQANMEEAEGEVRREKNVEDFEFYSKEENRNAFEEEIKNTALQSAKKEIAQLIVNGVKLTDEYEKVYQMYKDEIDELVVNSDTKKAAPKEKVKEDPDVKKEKAKANNKEAEDLAKKQSFFSETFDKTKAAIDKDITDAGFEVKPGNKGSGVLHEDDVVGKLTLIVGKDGPYVTATLKGKTIQFKDYNKLKAYIKEQADKRKKVNKYTVVPNKVSKRTPLTPELLSVVKEGEVVEFQSGNTQIFFQKIDGKFQWIYSIVDEQKIDALDSEEALRLQARAIKIALDNDALIADWDAFVVTNIKGKEEELEEEDGDAAATIGTSRLKFWEEWAKQTSEKESNENTDKDPLEFRERDAQTTLSTVRDGEIQDNANLDIDFLYSPIEEEVYQLEVDMTINVAGYRASDTHSWLNLPIVLIAPERRENSDNKQGGRLGHLPTLTIRNGHYDLEKSGMSLNSYNLQKLDELIEKASNTPNQENRLKTLHALRLSKLTEIEALVALRQQVSNSEKITPADKANLSPVQVKAEKKSGGIINSPQYTPIRGKFEPNDAFGLGVNFTFAIARSETTMAYGQNAEATPVQDLGVVSKEMTRGSVYIISHPNLQGNYIPIKISKNAVGDLNEEQQNVIVDFVLEQVERFKNSASITTDFKTEIEAIEDNLTKLFMVVRSNNKNGHGQIVLDTVLHGEGESRVNGAYFAFREFDKKTKKLIEHRFYYRTKKGDTYRNTPKNTFNYAKYEDGVQQGKAKTVGKDKVLAHMQNLLFDIRLDLLNQPGDFEAPVDLGQEVGTYNDFLAQFILSSDALMITRGDQLLKPNGFSTPYANPYFVIKEVVGKTKASSEVKTEVKPEVADSTAKADYLVGSIFIEKINPDGENTALTERQQGSIDKAIQMAINAGQTAEQIAEILNGLGYAFRNPLGMQAAQQTLINYINNRINGTDTRNVNEFAKDTKAELLGKKEEVITKVEEVKPQVVISEKVQAILKDVADSNDNIGILGTDPVERLTNLEKYYRDYLEGLSVPSELKAKFRAYKGKSFIAKDTATTRIVKDEAIAWFKKRFPELEVSFVEGLINNGVGTSWGMFVDNMVILSERAQAGVEYHEAFHAAFNMYTSPRKRAKILQEATKKFGVPTTKEVDSFRKENDVEEYSDSEVRDFILEEKMAEEYRVYEANRIANNKTAPLPTNIQKFFNALFDFLRHVFGRASYMERLYKNISAGNIDSKRIYKGSAKRNVIVNPLHPVFTPLQEAEIVNVFTGMYLQQWIQSGYDYQKADYYFLEAGKNIDFSNLGQGFEVIGAVPRGLGVVTNFDNVTTEQMENWIVAFNTLDAAGDYPGILFKIKEHLRKKLSLDVTQLNAKDFAAGVSKTYDMTFLAFNPTENVSKQIKSMFSMLQTNEISSVLGVPKYAKFNDVFPALHRRLANIPLLEDKLAMLYSTLSKFKTDFNLSDSVTGLMDLLQTDSNMRAKFFQTFNKYTHNEMRTIIDEFGNVRNQLVTSNNFQKELVDKWSQAFMYEIEQELRSQNTYDKEHRIAKYKEIGAQVEKASIAAFRDIDNATTEDEFYKALDGLVDVLDIFKATMGNKAAAKQALIEYVNNPIIYNGAIEALKGTPNNTNPVRILRYALTNSKSPVGKRVFTGANSLTSTLINGESLYSEKSEGLLKNIAEILSLNYLEKYENTALTLTGEKHWVINHPTPLAIFLSEIDSRISEFEYLEFSNWLKEFKEEGHKFVAYKHQGVYNERDASEYENMTDVERSATSIALFLDSYIRQSSDHSRFLLDLPFEADKTRHEVLSVPKYVSAYKDGKFIFDVEQNKAFAAFVNTVKQERALMEKWNKILDDNFEFDGDTIIEESITEENRKYLIEPLLVRKQDGAYVRNVKASFITDTTSSPEKAAENYIKEATKAQLNAFLKEGFIVKRQDAITGESKLVSKFIDESVYSSYGSIDKIVTDFVVNTTIGLREFKLFMTGVDQFYGAAAKENKRMAQYGTPATTLLVEGGVNEFYGNLVINDIIESVDEETLTKIKDWTGWNDEEVSHFLNLTTNDGQGWATLNRIEEILKGLGESVQDPKQLEAFERLKNGEALSFDEYISLSIKGFYYRFDYIPELGIHVPQQVKYNLYPLAPQFTTGLKLDAVRRKAEELESQSGVTVEIIPESAYKVGTRGMIPVTNIEDASVTNLVMLHNNAWGKQQENPIHEDDYAQKLGVQIAKLMLSNINPEGIYELPLGYSGDTITTALTQNNKQVVTGRQLLIEASGVMAELVRGQINEFKKEISDANGQITDTTFANILEQALLKEDKSYNLLELLRVAGDFSLPLGAHPSIMEMEPQLKSMFNNLRKIPILGQGYVQLSDALIDSDGTVPQNSRIKWLDSKTDRKLKVEIKDGIIYAECLVSIGKNGVDGVTDINKIERDAPELLRRMGYRIPTSGKSYVVVFKTVGFIENTVAAETIVAPFALMATMGYDFDVDKLYVMRRHGKLQEGGELRVVDRPSNSGNRKYLLTNRLLDIYETIYNSPYHAKEIFATGEFKKMEEVSAEYDITDKNLNTNTYAGQRALNKRNMDGVSLKGIFAGANGFLPIAQISNMQTSIPVRVIVNGEEIELNQFGKIGDEFTNISGELITEVTGMFVAAIMDIVKKPTTALNNITTYNANVAITLATLGLDYRHIAAFMTSPAVVDITNINDRPEKLKFSPYTIAAREFYAAFGLGKSSFAKFLTQNGIAPWETETTTPLSLEELEKYRENPMLKLPKDKAEARKYLLENLDEYKHYFNNLINFKLFKDNATSYSDAMNVLSGDKSNDSLLYEVHERMELRDKLAEKHLITTRNKNGIEKFGVEGILGEDSSFESAKAFWEIDTLGLETLGDSSKMFLDRPDYRRLFNIIDSMFETTNKQQREALYKSFKASAIAYLNSQNDFFSDVDTRYYLSQDFISKFVAIKESPDATNFSIFDSLVVEYSETELNKNGGIPFIKFKNTDLTSVDKDEFTQQLKEMLEGDNDILGDFVVELIKYQFVTTGFATTINSFSHIIPSSVYYDSGMKIASTISELSKLDAFTALGENFFLDFAQHNARFIKKIPQHKALPNTDGEVVLVDAKDSNFSPFFRKVIKLERNKTTVYSTQLFIRIGEMKGSVVYARIDTKGIPNKVFEYGSDETVIPDNKAKKPISEVINLLSKDKDFRIDIPDFSVRTRERLEENEFDSYEEVEPIMLSTSTPLSVKTTVAYYTGDIIPEENTIFVFGSNPIGVNGRLATNEKHDSGGAAAIAQRYFGVEAKEIMDNKFSKNGKAYGLVTVTGPGKSLSITPEQIIENIKKLYNTALENPDKQFKVAYRNTNKKSLNGYTGLEMIDMFIAAGNIPSNIVFSEEWYNTGKFGTTTTIEEKTTETKSPEQVLSESIENLTVEEKKVLEEVRAEEAPDKTTEEFVTDEVIKVTAGKKTNSKISAIIRKIANAIMAIGFIFTGWFTSTSLIIPNTAGIEGAAAIYTDTTTSYTDKVIEYHNRNHPNEPMFIISKTHRYIKAFDSTGTQVYMGGILIGATAGDTIDTELTKTKSYKGGRDAARAGGYAITPSGTFTLSKQKDDVYGGSYIYKFRGESVLVPYKDSPSRPALHLNLSKADRQKAYHSKSTEDNSITMGCVGMNMKAFEAFDNITTDNMHIYVIPETDNKEAFDDYLLYSELYGEMAFRDYLRLQDKFEANKENINKKYPGMTVEDIYMFSPKELDNLFKCL